MYCLLNLTALELFELHVFQLIVMLFHLAVLTDLILYYLKYIILLMKLNRIIYFAGFS